MTEHEGIRCKIVHLTSVHRPLDVRIFAKQCTSLAARGHEVVLVAVHDQDELRDGVLIKAVRRPRGVWTRMILTAARVFREALRQRGDLYQIHDSELLPWALLLRWLGKTVVYDMHENVPKDILDKTWLSAWLKPPIAWFVRVAERILMYRLPVIFAETSYRRDYSWVKRSVVVLNLPRLDRLPPPAAQRLDPVHVGYIGGVARDRGSVVTIQALGELKHRGLDVGWRCVGPMWPPDHARHLRELARQLGVTRVEFFGYLPSREGWQIIRECHIGLAVIADRPNLRDSFPTKLFEYMALEMPVITSDFPLYREVVDSSRCGICIDPESPSQLADAIESLVRDPQRLTRMGRLGRLAVEERYNWQSELMKLEGFYEQLL